MSSKRRKIKNPPRKVTFPPGTTTAKLIQAIAHLAEQRHGSFNSARAKEVHADIAQAVKRQRFNSTDPTSMLATTVKKWCTKAGFPLIDVDHVVAECRKGELSDSASKADDVDGRANGAGMLLGDVAEASKRSNDRPELLGLQIRLNRNDQTLREFEPRLVDYLGTASRLDMVAVSGADIVSWPNRTHFDRILSDESFKCRIVLMDFSEANKGYYEPLVAQLIGDSLKIKKGQAIEFKKLLDSENKDTPKLKERLEVKTISGIQVPYFLWLASDGNDQDIAAHLATWMFSCKFNGPMLRITDPKNPLMGQIRNEFDHVWGMAKVPDWSWVKDSTE